VKSEYKRKKYEIDISNTKLISTINDNIK